LIKILADQNLYKLDLFLPEQASVSYYNPLENIPSLSGYDAWLLRTVTKVNHNSPFNIPSSLKFIGTGSAGNDHLDLDFLKSHNVKVSTAKGCNANAVAEYVLTALLLLQKKYNYAFTSKKIGIIGVGAVGRSVASLLSSFDCSLVLYDPPRSLREPTFKSASMSELQSCDIISLHVPYTTKGTYKTQYLIDEAFLSDQSFDVIINASRGGVTNEKALFAAHEQNKVRYLITDVWDNEPLLNYDFVKQSVIATPHIAGYSEQAKLNASSMIMYDLCSHFGLKNYRNTTHEIKTIDLADLSYTAMDLINRCHPILEYDAALRDLIKRSDPSNLFAKLRTDRPYRFEYPFIRLKGVNLSHYPDLLKLGVQN
jgi:erythronate-4-phosphate dehydrogenase